MNENLESLKAGIGASLQRTRAFYSSHRTLLLSGLTALSILLIVWARMGFTVDFSRFYAVEPGDTCEVALFCDGDELRRIRADCEDILVEVCANGCEETGPGAARCIAGPAPSNSGECHWQNPDERNLPECACNYGTNRQNMCHVCTSSWQQGNTNYSDGQWTAWDNLGLCQSSCPAKFPYKTERTKMDGSPFPVPQACVEKPPDCPDGYHAVGNTQCEVNGGGGIPTPTPTHTATPGSCPTPPTTSLPATLSVVCGTTQNVLTWQNPRTLNAAVNSVIRNVNSGDGQFIFTEGGCWNTFGISTYTDTNVQSGTTYAYRVKTNADAVSNTVTCGASPTPDATPLVTINAIPDPLTGVLGTVSGTASDNVGVTQVKVVLRQGPPGVFNSATNPDWNGTNFINNNGVRFELNATGTAPLTNWSYAQTPPADKMIVGKVYTLYAYSIDTAGQNSGTGGTYRSFTYTGGTATPTPVNQQLACAPLTQTVALQQVATITATGGDGTYQWELSGSGVQQGGTATSVAVSYSVSGQKVVRVSSAGQSATCVITVTDTTATQDNNACVSHTIPSTMTPGQSKVVTVTFKNTGTSTWVPTNWPNVGSYGITFWPWGSGIPPFDPRSEVIPAASVAPGQNIVFTFNFHAPTAQGTYTGTQYRMVHEGVEYFGDACGPNTIVVKGAVAGIPGTVQTGPGDAVVAALLMSAIMTLLYVSYTHTSAYKRKEIEAITKDRDPMDFRS